MMFQMMLAAVVALAAAAYAQTHIGRFTASEKATKLTRIGLALLGLIFGYVAADNFGAAEAPVFLTFLIGFGAVHVPAALILLVKQLSGAGKS
jgi:hypothetical protein